MSDLDDILRMAYLAHLVLHFLASPILIVWLQMRTDKETSHTHARISHIFGKIQAGELDERSATNPFLGRITDGRRTLKDDNKTQP